MRQPDRALSALFYFFAAVFGAGLLHIVQEAGALRPPHDDVSTADFLGIILSALGVMVAILTFFLGVLAFFGWTAFRTLIEDKFEELFRRRFDASNAEYGKIIEQLVEDARAQTLVLSADDELPENTQPADQEPE